MGGHHRHDLHVDARRFVSENPSPPPADIRTAAEYRRDQSSAALGRCLAAETPTPSQLAVRREAAVRLADTIARLPADYQMVLLLRVFEGLSAEEVAQRMNRSPGAVRMLQLRALTALRAELKEPSSL